MKIKNEIGQAIVSTNITLSTVDKIAITEVKNKLGHDMEYRCSPSNIVSIDYNVADKIYTLLDKLGLPKIEESNVFEPLKNENEEE